MRKVILFVALLSVFGLCSCIGKSFENVYSEDANSTQMGKMQESNSLEQSVETEETEKRGDEETTDFEVTENSNADTVLNATESEMDISKRDSNEEDAEHTQEEAVLDDTDDTGGIADTSTSNDTVNPPAVNDNGREEPQQTETTNVYEPVSYSPERVVALSIAICEAGGMITTEHNLDNLLAEGKITQEEYDEYYPLDGMEGSYYSVFVETDLNKASYIARNPLPSEEAIADYIAEMLLLETHPIFNVTYAGIYTSGNGTQFYEFRCHR